MDSGFLGDVNFGGSFAPKIEISSLRSVSLKHFFRRVFLVGRPSKCLIKVVQRGARLLRHPRGQPRPRGARVPLALLRDRRQ